MSKYFSILIILLLFSSVSCSGITQNIHETKWEYFEEAVICDAENVVDDSIKSTNLVCLRPSKPGGWETYTKFVDILNEYGADGWELISANRDTIRYLEGYYSLIFKRPVSTSSPLP